MYVCVFEMPLILLSLIFCGQLLVSLIIGFCMFCNQEAKEQEVRGLEGQVSAIQQVLSDLKVQLYAKFGNNINLEADESWAKKQDTDGCVLTDFFIQLRHHRHRTFQNASVWTVDIM